MDNPDKTQPKQRGKPFTKGVSGNPNGRPEGSRSKTTLAVLELLDGEAEKLTPKCVDLALSGDSTALRLCIERIAPAPKDKPLRFPIVPHHVTR